MKKQQQQQQQQQIIIARKLVDFRLLPRILPLTLCARVMSIFVFFSLAISMVYILEVPHDKERNELNMSVCKWLISVNWPLDTVLI